MEEQNCDDAYRRMILNGFSGFAGEGVINQQCLLTSPEIYGLHHHHMTLPASQWIQPKQTPQYYVDLPAENVCPQNQKEMMPLPYHVFPQVPSLGLSYTPPLEEYMSTQNEEKKFIKFTSVENMFDVQKQASGDDYACAFQLPTEPSAAAASKNPSEARRIRSKEKAYLGDRCRRLRISRWIDALQELLPQPERKKRSKEALLDEAIQHVQHLQHQMKDLCRSRLGGETGASPLLFIEGHGHYAVRGQMLYGPLEDKIGKLMEINPSAFKELLQSRGGLFVMPMTFAEILPQS